MSVIELYHRVVWLVLQCGPTIVFWSSLYCMPTIELVQSSQLYKKSHIPPKVSHNVPYFFSCPINPVTSTFLKQTDIGVK